MRNLIAFWGGVCIAALLIFASSSASAQSTYAGLDHINRIISGTPGIATAPVAGGVGAVASGAVNVDVPGGVRIPVPTSVSAGVRAASIGKAAAYVGKRVFPWVGAASIAIEIATYIKDSGTVTCPPPDFFCKPQPKFQYYYIGKDTTYHLTNDLACKSFNPVYFVKGPTQLTCYYKSTQDGQDYAGYTLQNSVPKCWDMSTPKTWLPSSDPNYCPSGAPLIPAQQADIEAAVTARAPADPAGLDNLYDKMQGMHYAEPSIQSPFPWADYATTPITMNAPPVTTPEVTVRTETIPAPDGSSVTKVTKESTTVTPTIAPGATLADPKITFPSSTTQTTTITNNTTGAVTTETTIVNNPPALPADKIEMPTDYNREVTQKQILDELAAQTAPAMAEQKPVVDSAVAKAEADLAAQRTAVTQDQETDGSKFFSWVWTPPIGSCSAPTATVGGHSVSWDICPTVLSIKEVMAWIFGILGLASVYSELFRKGDD